MIGTRCRKVILYISPIFLSIAVMVHFCLILFHVMPKNPISNEMSPVVNKYVNPLFTQNWHLFSPNPLVRNDIIYMQIKFKDSPSLSEWFDITTPMIKGNYKNYFSPLNRLVRIPLTSAVMMNGMDDEERSFMNKVDKEHVTKEQASILQDIEKRAKKNEERMQNILYRFAFTAAEKYFANQQVDSLRVRIVHEEPVPFSKRLENDFKRERTHQDLEWKKYIPVMSW
ncbi:DUF5819 family protein [Bacillus thuringiensis]|uniref:DUF5819 family protein n=2 Tax=Bacillaceae TaxID=186817 RepID=UPI001D1C2FE4|nr:DUF5819 family protein [Bacillus thuringiensis]MBG9504187.1 hypothetical protein [Bacillus thuringiensis]MBG9508384.1 hypothetical protein [Bacillus thuringiensis]MBG9516107.1 hypothetical protein [Bacillus thuringiensis]MED3389048.1 DUF5819 family protein [Bacillus thuringiensis]